MVASTSSPPSDVPGGTGDSPRLQQDDVEQHEQAEVEAGRGGVRHLLAAASKLASLQYRIIMTKLKLTMMRIAISTGLYLGAAVFGIVAVILLLVAGFHFLLRFMSPELAYLIFGVTLLVLAVSMVLIASRMIAKDDDDDDDDKEDAK